jgi:nucleoside-diphosphate-sugar epimerase
MRVFLTGATGFIGSAIVPDLIGAGHQVLGLARSEAGAEALLRAGAEVHRGDLDDIPSLLAGAANSDAVIHTAFNHDFSKFVANCENDRKVIEALGSVLSGSDRPLIITSGTGMANTVPGEPALEGNEIITSAGHPRAASEEAGATVADRDCRVMVMRLPQVHDTRKQGLVTYAIQAARAKGVSAYVGDGLNRWPAAHVLDTAQLYRLALEKGKAGGKYHAVAEEGVTVREIAEAIGQGLNIPVVSLSTEEAQEHFGWLATFVGFDLPASSEQTRRELGWSPNGPGMLSDLRDMDYAAV